MARIDWTEAAATAAHEDEVARVVTQGGLTLTHGPTGGNGRWYLRWSQVRRGAARAPSRTEVRVDWDGATVPADSKLWQSLDALAADGVEPDADPVVLAARGRVVALVTEAWAGIVSDLSSDFAVRLQFVRGGAVNATLCESMWVAGSGASQADDDADRTATGLAASGKTSANEPSPLGLVAGANVAMARLVHDQAMVGFDHGKEVGTATGRLNIVMEQWGRDRDKLEAIQEEVDATARAKVYMDGIERVTKQAADLGDRAMAHAVANPEAAAKLMSSFFDGMARLADAVRKPYPPHTPPQQKKE